MNADEYLIIHKSILPEIFLKVVQTKDILKNDKARSIAEAVQKTGISRSSFYKYSDYIFNFTDGFAGKRATINMMLDHNSGQLSKVLDTIALHQGNILTISQSMPIENKANVTITMDISDMSATFGQLSKDIQAIEGVSKYRLEAIHAQTPE